MRRLMLFVIVLWSALVLLSGCGQLETPLAVTENYMQALQVGNDDLAGRATCSTLGGTTGWMDNARIHFRDISYSQMVSSVDMIVMQVSGTLQGAESAQPFIWEIKLHKAGNDWCIVEILNRQKLAAAYRN